MLFLYILLYINTHAYPNYNVMILTELSLNYYCYISYNIVVCFLFMLELMSLVTINFRASSLHGILVIDRRFSC